MVQPLRARRAGWAGVLAGYVCSRRVASQDSACTNNAIVELEFQCL
jgi:hypothetical protein